MAQKNKKDINDYLDDVEREITNTGADIVQGVYQNLKSNLKQSLTQGIVGAITGQNNPQAPPQPPIGQELPSDPPRFMKQPNPNINLNIPSLRENLNWFYGGESNRPNPFTLSAETDHFSYGEYITKLNPGEYYYFYFRILGVGEGGNFNHALEVLLDSGQNNMSGWVWNFTSGDDKAKHGTLRVNNEYKDDEYPLTSYKSDTINEIILTHDGKSVKLLLNREDVGYFINVYGESKFVRARVVGLNSTFWS